MNGHKGLRKKSRILALSLYLVMVLALCSCRRLPETIDVRTPKQNVRSDQLPGPAVQLLLDREYYPRVMTIIDGAEESIDLIMYQVRFYAAWPDSPSNALLAGLIDAAERDVRVRVLLETSTWNPENAVMNYIVGELLSRHGIEVRYDSPEVNTHAKLCIIDRQYVILGSTNWSHYSLTLNNEANIVIADTNAASTFSGWFERLHRDAATIWPIDCPECLPATFAEKQEPRNENILCRYEGIVRTIEPAKNRSDSFIFRFEQHSCVLGPLQTEEWFALMGDFPRTLRGKTGRFVFSIMRDSPNSARSSSTARCTILDSWNPGMTDLIERGKLINRKRAGRETDTVNTVLPWLSVEGIEIINDERYMPRVLELIGSARKHITVAQIQSDFIKPRWPEHDPPTNKLLDQLLAARRRNVSISFLTDCRNEPFSTEKKIFLKSLRKSGATVICDNPDVTTHVKMLIVDHRTVVIGSTNWSVPALSSNHESSVLIHSTRLADLIETYVLSLGSGPAFPSSVW